mmetsp:Transcript_8549/g.21250  ORF Transcript_8549/g.21250 Transcript_8549/m.21250 type:complete len:234 (+) Transcript_8549:119-820(+)
MQSLLTTKGKAKQKNIPFAVQLHQTGKKHTHFLIHDELCSLRLECKHLIPTFCQLTLQKRRPLELIRSLIPLQLLELLIDLLELRGHTHQRKVRLANSLVLRGRRLGLRCLDVGEDARLICITVFVFMCLAKVDVIANLGHNLLPSCILDCAANSAMDVSTACLGGKRNIRQNIFEDVVLGQHNVRVVQSEVKLSAGGSQKILKLRREYMLRFLIHWSTITITTATELVVRVI